MEDAWLASLTEDWISQPRSVGSPACSLPTFGNGTLASDNSNGGGDSSRILFHDPQRKRGPHNSDGIGLPLSERSASDINVSLSQRGSRRPSKLPRGTSNGTWARRLSRTVSNSTTESIQHHTVQHKSLSAFPQRLRCPQDTPEWKRRLIHGDVAYGEQRDLFSPAGLETLFRPPPAQNLSSIPTAERIQSEDEAMPSSPPTYALGNRPQPGPLFANDASGPAIDPVAKGSPSIGYKVAGMASEQFFEDELSRSSNFHPAFTTSHRTMNDTYQTSPSENTNRKSGTPSRSESVIGVGREFSGQSDIRHEDLSPIFISCHNTIHGNVNCSPFRLSDAEMQKLRQGNESQQNFESSQVQDVISRPLPGTVIINTDDITNMGGFVNLERGGRSEDGSFQQRMLSPSSLPRVDESEMLHEASIQASTPKRQPNTGERAGSADFQSRPLDSLSSRGPLTPHRRPVKDEYGGAKPGSGSPLKLFGTYDTFTSQKLLRRLSQFENSLPDESIQNSTQGTKLGDTGIESTNHTEMNEAYIAPSSPAKASFEWTSKISQFGDGHLDQYEFSEEQLDSSRLASLGVEGHGSTSAAAPDSEKGIVFQLQPSPSLEYGTTKQKRSRQNIVVTRERVVMTRDPSHLSPLESGSSSILPVPSQLEDLGTPRKDNGGSEGKRLLRSPPKNSTPKRRRTLHRTDISHNSIDNPVPDLVRESHEQIQSVVGRKRKDARHSDNQEPADPQILAMRQILRPKTVTAGQRHIQEYRRGQQMEIEGAGDERQRLEQQEKIARVQAELDLTVPHRTDTIVGGSRPMFGDSRKGSVTTQDFFDEAKIIMAGLRRRTRPSNDLTGVEESEPENNRQAPSGHELDEDDTFQESSKEPFSRPPSRDGGPVPRLPQKQHDPDVLDHLKKYQEVSELGDIVSTSLKSIGQTKDDVLAVKKIDRLTDEVIKRASEPAPNLDLDQAYQSDPPNIQITEYPELQRQRKHSTSSAPRSSDETNDARYQSHNSNALSEHSTGRSVPTGSSKGSDSKHIIAPHTVSHLIPEQLAGMVFDREKHIWVKRKTLNGENDYRELFTSEESDEDPFDDIPDLTVDETQELNRIKAVAARQREEARTGVVQKYHTGQRDIKAFDPDWPNITKAVPDSRETSSTTFSEPSKVTRIASSNMAQDTRLTSWGNELEPGDKEPHPMRHSQPSEVHEAGEIILEGVEQEISIHESRVKQGNFSSRRRNVTISFSSPIASIINPERHDVASESENEGSLEGDSFTNNRSVQRKSYATKMCLPKQTAPRKFSLGNHTFLARPVSRIDEQEECSFVGRAVHDASNRSVSLMISTPLPTRSGIDQLSTIPPSSAIQHSEDILQLTPLSDFTINQPDESFMLEVSYIGQRPHRSSSTGKRSLSISVKELVQRITDIEPYEPFWENIKNIDLRGKRLRNLHMLSNFCGKLEELDVSENEIGQLDGAPATIRHLRISQNCLSDLSSWTHLSNLQYVDVSNNELTSLEAFKDLVHLRVLRADQNRIQSLKGVESLDGLISLRLRNNMVDFIDFAGTSLQRLIELDLKGNCLRNVRNLQDLRSLTTLNLEDNDLRAFERENGEDLWALKYLKLGGNNLEQIDVRQYPNLRVLYLDRNRLGTISGLLRTKYLDSLSLREQQDGFSVDQTFMNEAFEVRKLFLSGNLLTSFNPSADFLNLQYLELANCGLESLPIYFGQIASNLRILNLNYNALRDIKPLLGIVRLKKLHLAGNRLARLRKTTNVLSQFSSLTKVDLRNNPLTLGFYPPVLEKRVVLHDSAAGMDTSFFDPFTLQDGDVQKDNAYARRLDMDTRMRRRVFDMLMLGGCANLRLLDGLRVDRAKVNVRDKVWDELVGAGLLFESNARNPNTNLEAGGPQVMPERIEHEAVASKDDHTANSHHSETASEERWLAEDSFA